MTDSERRGLAILLVILTAGAILSAVSERFPGLLPDRVRHAAAPAPRSSSPPVWRARALPTPAAQAPADPARSAAVRTRGRERPAPRSVDVNACDAAALASLPGIGPTRARAILAERAAHGRFREPRDLLRVRGIGPRILERMEPYLTFRTAPASGRRASFPASRPRRRPGGPSSPR